ncbi:recombinase family protein [Mesorhizobium sp. GR13]|uniref:recombinase family protein n=1 Tax=Mesorhizobium sp. GR13 TaxID=2562308 RepID=UPI001485A698|nr:recombinase family protein [Mesorhizobium sp. GR13]
MSTDIQLKGDSLRRQEELSRRYAESNNLELVEDFKLEDIGVSAFKGINISSGSLGRFLAKVKAKEIEQGSYLLVESLDRITRQEIMTSVTIFLDIVRSGINIVTLADNHLYRAGQAELQDLIYSLVVMSRAHEESKIKSQRVAAAWNNKRNNLSTKKLTQVCPAWIKLSDNRKSYSIVENRDEVIREIFAKADSGYGSFALARTLTRNGVPTFGKSRVWNESYITKILNNRAVLGEFQPHRLVDGIRIAEGDPVPEYFPRIVDDEIFYRVQAARRKRHVEGGGRKGPKYRNLFTNIAKCAYCGAPMRFIHKGYPPKGGTYLKCSRAVRKDGCETKGWPYKDFEKSFLFFVKEVDLSETIKALSEKSEKVVLEGKLLAVEEKIRELETKRGQLLETLALLKTSPMFVAAQIDSVQGQIDEHEIQRASIELDLKEASERAGADPEEIRAMISDLQDPNIANSFDKRAAVANRLRNVIKSLKIAVEGRGPKLKQYEQLLGGANIDHAYRQRVLAHIRKTNDDGMRNNRTFSVQLADGVFREVVLSNDDPTSVVINATYTDELGLLAEFSEQAPHHK